MRFLNELHEGDRISGIYLCKQKQPAVTKNGKPYENIILQDKTGMMDGKIWDPNSLGIDDFDALDYIEVMGDVTSFAGAMQLNIKRVRKAGEGEYNPAGFPRKTSVPSLRSNALATWLFAGIRSIQVPLMVRAALSGNRVFMSITL